MKPNIAFYIALVTAIVIVLGLGIQIDSPPAIIIAALMSVGLGICIGADLVRYKG